MNINKADRTILQFNIYNKIQLYNYMLTVKFHLKVHFRFGLDFPIEPDFVEFVPQMAFPGKINRRFRKSKYDFLLVFHYNYWCILLNNKVIGYFRLRYPY